MTSVVVHSTSKQYNTSALQGDSVKQCCERYRCLPCIVYLVLCVLYCIIIVCCVLYMYVSSHLSLQNAKHSDEDTSHEK